MVLANTTLTVGGTLASNLVNSLTTQSTNQSNANTALGGLVQNLNSATTDRTITAICNQIMATPNAGAAVSIAEKIINDLSIADPTLKQITLMHDMATLQAVVTVQTHSTGVLSSLLAGLGL